MFAAPSAITRSGMTSASAPIRASGQEVADHVARGDRRGVRQLRMRALGRGDVHGRKAPSLCGTSGLTTAFIANDVYAWV